MSQGVKIVLTEYQEKYIRINYLVLPVGEVASHLGLSKTTLRHFAYAMGIKKFSIDHIPPAAVEFIEFVYPYLGDTEIAEYFEKHFPKSKPWTKKHIEKKRHYLGLKRTKPMYAAIRRRNRLLGCWAEGSVLMWNQRGRTPVGTVRQWKHPGGCVVAIKTETGFVNYYPWLWEKHNGPVPEGFVVYCDPDAPVECDISHLSLKTRAEIMDMNRYADGTVIKRMMKIRDPEMIEIIKNDFPHLVELKRNEVKLKSKLRELSRKDK